MTRAAPVALLLLITASVMSAAAQSPGKAPRTASGHPDLQGVWNFTSAVRLQRPAAYGDRKLLTKEESDSRPAANREALATLARFAPVEAVGVDLLDFTPLADDRRTSLITYPDTGRLPALVEGVRRRPGVEDFVDAVAQSKGALPASLVPLLAGMGTGKKDSHLDFSMAERCLLAAPVPFVPHLDGNVVQIVQSPDHLAVVTEFDRRIITLTAAAPSGDAPRSWKGISRGRWEGETLVVETSHFNGRMPSFAGAGSSRDKVVTERFTRISQGVLLYAATVVDPKTFQDRIELSFPMTQVDHHTYEAACHEGNYSLRHALSAARRADEAGR